MKDVSIDGLVRLAHVVLLLFSAYKLWGIWGAAFTFAVWVLIPAKYFQD